MSDKKIFSIDSYSECVSSQTGPLNSPCAPNWIKWVEAYWVMLHTKYQGTRHCRFRQEDFICFPNIKFKAEDKNQKSIQSSTTTDPRHHMGKWQNTRKHHTQEIQEIGPFLVGDHMPMSKYATSKNVTFKPQGYNLNKLGGGLLGYATYQTLRL